MATKTVTVRCPFCGSEQVTKNRHNRTGKQVYRCNNPACQRKSFVEEYTYKVCEPEVAGRCSGWRSIVPEYAQQAAYWAYQRIL